MRIPKITKHRATQLAITIIAAALLCSGTASLIWPRAQAAWQRHEGSTQNVADLHKVLRSVKPMSSMQLGTPISISIPRLGINLGIEKGTYNPNTQTWTIDHSHAFWMQTSTGQTATPIIYGHDIPAVFEHLAGVANNEILRITNSGGQVLLFRYVGDQTLVPSDNGLLTTHFADSIILMTCSGAQYQYRRALQFKYVGIQDSSVQYPGVSA